MSRSGSAGPFVPFMEYSQRVCKRVEFGYTQEFSERHPMSWAILLTAAYLTLAVAVIVKANRSMTRQTREAAERARQAADRGWVGR